MNHSRSKVWDDVTYPFPIFNDCTVAVKGWISNFISHVIMDVVIHPCRHWSQTIVNGDPAGRLLTGITFKDQSFGVDLVDHVCYGRQVSQVEGRGPFLPRRLWMVSGFEHVFLIVGTEYTSLVERKSSLVTRDVYMNIKTLDGIPQTHHPEMTIRIAQFSQNGKPLNH